MNPLRENLRANEPSAWQALRRAAQPRWGEEACDFCSLPLSPGHRHLLEVSTRKILCVCDPCGLRFENVVGRWKLVPRSARALPGFRMSDAQWEALALPIDLVFIFSSTPSSKPIALYPSPAGAVESLLPLNDWERLASANPDLASMEPDVEALLINRVGVARQYFLAPVDWCYELSGLVRLHWRGLSGGPEIWRQIGVFFERLYASAGASLSCPQEVVHA